MGLLDVYESSSEGHIFLVQELCSGGTLSDLILRKSTQPIGEERAAGLFRGIIKSVLHCHQVGARGDLSSAPPPWMGELHRDVMPDTPLIRRSLVFYNGPLPRPTWPFHPLRLRRWACCTAT